MKNSHWYFLGLAISIIFNLNPIVVLILMYVGLKISESYENSSKGDDILDFFNKMRTTKNGRTYVSNQKQNSFSFPNIKFNPANMNSLGIKFSISTFIAVLVLLVILDGFVSIPAGHVGVIFNRIGGGVVLDNSFDEGLHLKIPFVQKVTKMNTRIQTYTMSIAPSEGEIYGDDAIESLTKDGQKVNVDLTVQFHIDKGEAPVVYKKIGLDYVYKIVRPAARSVAREVITGYNSKELFAIETRQKVQDQIEEQMKENLESRDVTLDAVLLRNVQFSQTYLNAIEDKQVAEQRIQKAEFEKQEAEIRKQKKIIEAEAEAESIKLKGEALRKNQEIIQLEMVNKLSPNIKWGVLPDGVMPLLNLNDIKN